MDPNAASPASDAAPPPGGRPLRIAYLAPAALVDPASGAAQSIGTMLEQLAKLGAHCEALSATCFDAAHGANLDAFLEARGIVRSARVAGVGLPIWSGRHRGVQQTLMHSAGQRRMLMNALEEMCFGSLAGDWLMRFKPDVVITYGGLLLEMELQRIAQRSGALVTFYLANAKYTQRNSFAGVDLVITNSAGTQQLYAERMQLASHNVGLFVDPAPLVAPQRRPEFVTFVNPQAEKGVTLFLKLVERAARERPDMKFLCIESRAKLAAAVERAKIPAPLLERVTVLPRQEDMREVYGRTKILLMPSFWFEAAGRVLIEATANAIPVLATNRGGIPETLAGGGVLLDIPQRCTTDHWAVPTDAEVQPWWDELDRLWTDAAAYEARSGQARKAAEGQSIDAKARRLASLLMQGVRAKQASLRQRAAKDAAPAAPAAAA